MLMYRAKLNRKNIRDELKSFASGIRYDMASLAFITSKDIKSLISSIETESEKIDEIFAETERFDDEESLLVNFFYRVDAEFLDEIDADGEKLFIVKVHLLSEPYFVIRPESGRGGQEIHITLK